MEALAVDLDYKTNAPPTEQALQLLLRVSIMKRLVRQSVLVQEQDQWYVADGITEDTGGQRIKAAATRLDCLSHCLRSQSRS